MGRSAVRSARDNGFARYGFMPFKMTLNQQIFDLRIAETIEVEISLSDLKSSSKCEYGSSTIEQRFRNSLCLKDI